MNRKMGPSSKRQGQKQVKAQAKIHGSAGSTRSRIAKLLWALDEQANGVTADRKRWMTFGDKAYEAKDREPSSPLEVVLKKYAWANSGQVMDIVLDNWNVLRDAGLVEEAFLDAWWRQKHGFPNWSKPFCDAVVRSLQREKLLAVGDALPAGDSFTVYRGVAGVGANRRVHGYSDWDIDVARHFARVRAFYRLPNPAIYRAEIRREHVLAYINESGRNEQEFLLLPRHLSKIKRIERLITQEGSSL